MLIRDTSVFKFSIPVPPSRNSVVRVNPINIVCSLTWKQQALFWSGWLAWLVDSYDFFCVSLTVIRLDSQFNINDNSLTTAITLTLLFRSLGAFLFGLSSDRFGRKWPLIVVLLTIALLQLGTGFVNTFPQFLACRSLFGIAMGGVWGLASATSMENMPVEARGLYSGFMQVGYPAGYLVASVVNLFLVPRVPQTWRSIYWVGCGISVFAAFIRFLLPESTVFVQPTQETHGKPISSVEKTSQFTKHFIRMIKDHWQLWVYGLVLMSGMNFLSHGSQDLYTTFMQRTKGFSSNKATEANIVGECGAVFGAVLGGYTSQFLGRRLTLVLACLGACAFIPLWILPSSWSLLSIGAFFFQTGVNLGWGAIAVYLNELSPPAFRGLYPGTVYQLGNAASSAAAQIEATAGLHIRKQVFGVEQPDYGKVQAIMAACSSGLVILAVMFGPENHSVEFQNLESSVKGSSSEKADLEQVDQGSLGEKDEQHLDEYTSTI